MISLFLQWYQFSPIFSEFLFIFHDFFVVLVYLNLFNCGLESDLKRTINQGKTTLIKWHLKILFNSIHSKFISKCLKNLILTIINIFQLLITISSNYSVYKRFLRNFISSIRTRFSCSHFNSLVLYPVRSLLVLRNVFCKWSLNYWFPLFDSPSCMSSYIFISLFSLQNQNKMNETFREICISMNCL